MSDEWEPTIIDDRAECGLLLTLAEALEVQEVLPRYMAEAERAGHQATAKLLRAVHASCRDAARQVGADLPATASSAPPGDGVPEPAGHCPDPLPGGRSPAWHPIPAPV